MRTTTKPECLADASLGLMVGGLTWRASEVVAWRRVVAGAVCLMVCCTVEDLERSVVLAAALVDDVVGTLVVVVAGSVVCLKLEMDVVSALVVDFFGSHTVSSVRVQLETTSSSGAQTLHKLHTLSESDSGPHSVVEKDTPKTHCVQSLHCVSLVEEHDSTSYWLSEHVVQFVHCVSRVAEHASIMYSVSDSQLLQGLHTTSLEFVQAVISNDPVSQTHFVDIAAKFGTAANARIRVKQSRVVVRPIDSSERGW
mmetsp:Transcript_12558/g.34564  ORF Transcript_12558/g.34564 Transcript_12558/m.34564 type:complete len:254 (-) Transcript_12558:53-814(-)